jgi:hypothetical protein
LTGVTFEGHPIQVKQSDNVGRNVIDSFETAIRRRKATTGVIVAFSFGSGAYEEIARSKLPDNIDITALTVSEIIKNQNRKSS